MFLFLLLLGFVLMFGSLLAAKKFNRAGLTWGVLVGLALVFSAFLIGAPK